MKQKRYWLKGGVIVLILYGLSTLVLVPFGTPKEAWFPLWSLPSILGAGLLSAPINMITGNDYMDEFGIMHLV